MYLAIHSNAFFIIRCSAAQKVPSGYMHATEIHGRAFTSYQKRYRPIIADTIVQDVRMVTESL